MFNNIREQNMHYVQFSVLHVKQKKKISTALGLVFIAIILFVIFQAVQATAQEFMASSESQQQSNEFDWYGHDDSWNLVSATDQVKIGVTVLDNLSLRFEKGEPLIGTNHPWGASLQEIRLRNNLIILFASANF